MAILSEHFPKRERGKISSEQFFEKGNQALAGVGGGLVELSREYSV